MKKILFAMHMPPPYHGASMVGQRLHNHKKLNTEYECQYINISLASSLNDLGGAGLSKLKKYFCILLTILTTVKKFKPDLCYMTPNAGGKVFLLNMLMIICVMRRETKIVLHYHNKGVLKYQHKWFYNLCYKYLFHRVSVILLSERLYYDIEKYANKDNVYFSLMGIPDKPYKLIEKDATITFTFISNLIPSKGIYELLGACEMLKNAGKQFRLNFAGGETKEISKDAINRAIMRRGLSNICFYYGRVSEEEKEELLSHSHCFVFPTYYENECFPAALLEAMRGGLAVISTYEGAIPEEVQSGENGYLVQQRNVEELADAMKRYIDNPSLARVHGDKGRKLFEARFTEDLFMERILSIFATIIDK